MFLKMKKITEQLKVFHINFSFQDLCNQIILTQTKTTINFPVLQLIALALEMKLRNIIY